MIRSIWFFITLADTCNPTFSAAYKRISLSLRNTIQSRDSEKCSWHSESKPPEGSEGQGNFFFLCIFIPLNVNTTNRPMIFICIILLFYRMCIPVATTLSFPLFFGFIFCFCSPVRIFLHHSLFSVCSHCLQCISFFSNDPMLPLPQWNIILPVAQ